MVVDDNPAVLESLSLVLVHFGFEVNSFFDDEEALAATIQFVPDFLICDAHMNEVTESLDSAPEHIRGIEVASEIQHACPACIVIVMSGNLKPSIVLDRAEKLGAHVQTMPKPTSPDDLIKALARAA